MEIKGSEKRLEQLLAERDALKRNIAVYESEQKQLPPGTLYTKRQNGQLYFYNMTYHEGKQTRNYISKAQSKLIQGLQRKKEIKRALPDVERKLLVIEKCISVYEKTLPQSALLSYGRCQWDERIQRWMEAPMQYNTKNLEGKKFATIGGVLVRSKSELIIADMFESFNVPYKYDTVILLKDGPVSPDFQVMRPFDYKVLKWEHYGKTSDPNYRDDIKKKRSRYWENGYVPWDNLIETFDDEDGVINIKTIETIIKGIILIGHGK